MSGNKNANTEEEKRRESQVERFNVLFKDLGSKVSPELEKYFSLDYDIDYVETQATAFRQTHPEANAEALTQELQRLIIQESIVASYTKLLQSEGKTLEKIEETKANIRQKPNDYSEYEFFKATLGPKTVQRLQSYQKKAGNIKSVTEYKQKVNLALKAFVSGIKDKNDINDFGKIYHKGLLAATPDPKSMPVVADTEKAQRMIRAWKEDIEKVTLTPGSYLKTEELLEYAVMGRCLSDEALGILEQKVKLQNKEKNLTRYRNSFFQNLLKGSFSRLDNTYVVAVAPDARQRVKAAIDEDSQMSRAQLKADLQSAFDALYEEGVNSTTISSDIFLYYAEKLNQLAESSEKAGIRLNITPEQRTHLKVMKEERRLEMRILDLKEKLRENAEDMMFGTPEAAAYDIRRNPELYETIVELQACRAIQDQIEHELDVNDRTTVDSNTGYKLDGIADRKPTMTQRLLEENPEGILSYYKTLILSGDDMKQVMGENNADKRFTILINGGFLNHKRDYIQYADAAAWEYGTMGHHITEFLNKFEDCMNQYNNLDIRRYPRKEKIRDDLNQIRTSVQKLKAFRDTLPDPGTEESLEKLKPYYQNVKKYYDRLKKEVYMEENYVDSFDMLFNLRLDLIANQAENIDIWKKNIVTSKRLTEIMNAHKPTTNFEKAYTEHCENLKKLTAGKNMSEKYKEFIRDMESLHEVLSDRFDGRDIHAGEDIVGENGKYAKVIKDIDQLLKGKNKVSGDDMKYVLNFIRNQLTNDMREAGALLKSKDFNANLEAAQKSNSGDIVRYNDDRLTKLMGQMNPIAGKTNGNSDEFNDILKKLEAAKKLRIEGKTGSSEYLKAVEDLLVSTDTYIKAKKLMPFTTRGKNRLNIAKEMRDACRSLTAGLSEDIRKTFKITAENEYTDILNKIKNARKNAYNQVMTYSALLKNQKAKDGIVIDSANAYSRIGKAVSKLMYLDQLDKKAYQWTPEKLKTLMTDDMIKKQSGEIYTLIVDSLKKLPPSQLLDAVDTGTLTTLMHFNTDLSPAAIKAKLQEKNPDMQPEEKQNEYDVWTLKNKEAGQQVIVR